MKILINGVNLKVGGGVTVIMNFLKSVIENSEFHQHRYHVLVPSGVGYEEFNTSPVKVEIIPEVMKSPFKRLWLDYTWFDKKIKEVKPDVIFTMGNIAIPSQVKQGVLFMYPYAIYPEEAKVWEILTLKNRIDLRLRNRLFKSRLKYADMVFPQTKTSEKRLHQYYRKRLNKTCVIPTAYSKIDSGEKGLSFFDKQEGGKYLLCLTKYYKHKNVEIFLPLAKKLKAKGSKLKIVTTIGADQGEGAKRFIEKIAKNKLESHLINIGPVPFKDVPALYEHVDALILPTLLESFSATYADSLSLRVPIFTSDRDFAKDVCGDSAFYFDPLNAENIYQTLIVAFDKPKLMKEKIEKGYQRASTFPNWKAVTTMFVENLEKLGNE